VQLVGAVDNPLAWMRRARVFVLASQYEGFGNVLVEALAVGTRVVATDCPVGPREVLQDGRLGALLPTGDVRALAAAMAQALADDSGPRDPAEAEAVARRFTQARACEAYLALFDDIGAPS
jgi:glycosyltransferase involved in cell wall biosynthesis